MLLREAMAEVVFLSQERNFWWVLLELQHLFGDARKQFGEADFFDREQAFQVGWRLIEGRSQAKLLQLLLELLAGELAFADRQQILPNFAPPLLPVRKFVAPGDAFLHNIAGSTILTIISHWGW